MRGRVRLLQASVLIGAGGVGTLIAGLQDLSSPVVLVAFALFVFAIAAYRTAVRGADGRMGVVLANQSQLYRSSSFEVHFRKSSDPETAVGAWTAVAKRHGYKPAGPPQTRRTPFGSGYRMIFVRDSSDVGVT
jgi:hypothetical protein